MQSFLKKSFVFLISFIILLLSCLIYTILLYNNLVDTNIGKIYQVTFIMGTIFFFILGIIISLMKKEKSFFTCLLFTSCFLIIIIMVKLITKSFVYPSLIKYGIYLFSSLLGAMLFRKKVIKKPKKRLK